MASYMADAFSKVLEDSFKGKGLYLKYIKPFLAIPMFRQQKTYIYELEEYKNDVPFENYNRPNNKSKLALGNTLPNAFSHWTYEVTGGEFMIVDV